MNRRAAEIQRVGLFLAFSLANLGKGIPLFFSEKEYSESLETLQDLLELNEVHSAALHDFSLGVIRESEMPERKFVWSTENDSITLCVFTGLSLAKDPSSDFADMNEVRFYISQLSPSQQQKARLAEQNAARLFGAT